MITPMLTKLADEINKQFPPQKEKKENGTPPPGEEEEATEEEEEGAEEKEEEQGAATGTVDPKVVMDFFAKPGKITDADFHAFCEQNGFNVHEAESIAYSLAQALMSIVRGGKGAGLDPNQVDPQQLEWGLEIEKEHTDMPCLQKKIALDHLAEDPQYYSQEYMQKELQKEGGQEQGQQMDPEKTASLFRKIANCGMQHRIKIDRTKKLKKKQSYK